MNIISKIYFFCMKNTKKQRIVIPDWISEIPIGAFRGNHNIKEVYISESVQKIERNAFLDCNSLKKISFNGSVKFISSSAFPGNENIIFSFAKTIEEKDKNRMRASVKRDYIHRNIVSLDAEIVNIADITKTIIVHTKENVEDTKNIVSEVAEVQSVHEQELISTVPVAEKNESSEIAEENCEVLYSENTNEGNGLSEIASDVDTEQENVVEADSDIYEEDKVIVPKVIENEYINISDKSVKTVQNEYTEIDYEIPVETEANENLEDNDKFIQGTEQSGAVEDIPSETALIDMVNNTNEDTEPKSIEIIEPNNPANEESEVILTDSITEELIGENNSANEEQSDEIGTSDIAHDSKDEEIELYDEIVLQKSVRPASEKSIATVKSTRKATDNKDDIRQRDLKKYACKTSVSDIESSDMFISSLIEKYVSLENKYGYEIPLGMIDMTKEEYQKLARYVHGFITTEAPIVSLTAFLCSIFLVKTVANYDHNNNFWGAVSVLLKCDENLATKYLKEVLLYFCSSEKLYFHYYRNRHSYARTVLIHSIINRSTLNTVIDFIRDFYIEEMHESYDSNTVQSYIDIFVDEMVKDLSKISDDNSSGSDMGGIYKVSLAFKTACREFPDAVKDGLKCLLFNIDAYYHRTSDISYSPAVFNKYFKRWKINDIMQKRMNISKQGQRQHESGVRPDKKNIQ